MLDKARLYFRRACVFAVILALFCFSSCNQGIENHNNKNNKKRSIAKIAVGDDPQTLDPRKARDMRSMNVAHLLFEGLMQIDPQGNVTTALAESVEVSDNMTKFRFKIREVLWSNQDHLTAYDFEKTWKSMLDPDFPAPYAYQLFVIKGAKEAKEGKIPVDSVGIRVLDPYTLVVELDKPTPYFLELVACHFFFPVNRNFIHSYAETDFSDVQELVCNGPFQPKKWARRNEMQLEKNPFYWDHASVHLQGVDLVIADESTALQLYQLGELDWVGSPCSTIPGDAMQYLRKEGILEISPAVGVSWLRFNTKSPLLQTQKFRQALSLSIDRKTLVDHILQGNQVPALGIVPPSLWKHPEEYFEDHNLSSAWDSFQNALFEMQVAKDKLEPVVITYENNERNNKVAQALQQQWGQGLGIQVRLEPCESQILLDKLAKSDYDVGIGSWFADFRDPGNFLNVFYSAANGTNNTNWENAAYSELLDSSERMSDQESRNHKLKEAEKIIMEEMPVAPVFFYTFNYAKNPRLLGASITELGWLHIKHARFIDPNTEPNGFFN